MANFQRLLAVGVCLGLAAGITLAQIPAQTYRQTGNLVGASAAATGADYQANVNISPAALPNKEEMYVINWSTTVYGALPPPPIPCVLPPFPPPPPDLVATSASAYVPASAVQRSPSGGISIDLDAGALNGHVFIGSVQCAGGCCNPVASPATFPLKGTFAPVTSGPVRFSSSSNGHRSSVTADPICRSESTFSGTQVDTSANFAGQIGAVTVSVAPTAVNAQLHVQKGQVTSTATCTPPPPPM
jgi:hypothetical protein